MSGVVFIAWRSGGGANGCWGPVGRLERHGHGYRFTYTEGARTLPGFHPFPGMQHLDAVYESDTLFPLFANRLLAPSRPEFEAYLRWGGFDPRDPPDPIALLGVTEGRRATDSLEVFPSPVPDAEGRYNTTFFLHGVRWMPPAALAEIGLLQPGARLCPMLDILNQHDQFAVAIRTCSERAPVMIGYVPRYLAPDIYRLWNAADPSMLNLTVKRVNLDAPLQQRVLCCLLTPWPQSFHPLGEAEFQPIVSGLPLLAS